MNQKDLYQVLNVSRNVDEKELKKAYRKLAKKYHPDTNQGNAQAEAKFKEINEAYDILGDPEKRKSYDQFGMAAFDGSMGADPGGGSSYGGFYGQGNSANGFHGAGNTTYRKMNPDGTYTEYHFSGGDMGDMGGIFDDLFGGVFGDQKAGAGQNSGFTGDRSFHRGFGSKYGFDSGGFQQSASQNAQAEITISFEEAALGCEKRFRMNGDGRQEQIQVHIPAGIDEGQNIRLQGKGYAGGDLLLKVHVQESPIYERKGLDVYTKCKIPFATAALGGKARFRTLYGTVECKVPEGTQSGSKIRLKQKGIVSPKNPNLKGDEYVEIRIDVPRHVNGEERELIEKLAACQKA